MGGTIKNQTALFRNEPDKEIKSERDMANAEVPDIWWGSAAMCGWRSSMEDAHLIHTIDLPDNKKGMLYGVFDGHGGSRVAKFVKLNLKNTLINMAEFKKGQY